MAARLPTRPGSVGYVQQARPSLAFGQGVRFITLGHDVTSFGVGISLDSLGLKAEEPVTRARAKVQL